MRRKVVVTGASGMLGRDLCRELERRFRVIPLSRAELDITDPEKVEGVIGELAPQVVFNCAAFTKVDLCEEQRETAFAVNARGPENLAKACKSAGAKLVHVSTDYVFDGTARRPYTERSRTNPLNVYGQSKLEGERAVQSHAPDHLIVRTSWLFGEGGPNFIDTIVNLARQRSRLQVVDDQTGRPTYTKDLAGFICLLVERGATGMVNCANSGSCSWYGLSRFALELAGLGHVRVEPVTSDRFRRPARRPGYSVLDLSRFKAITGLSPRHWREAVTDYMAEKGIPQTGE